MKTNNNEEEFYKLDEYIEICKQKTPRNAKDYYIIKNFNVLSNNEGEYFLINNNNNNNIDTLPPVFISNDKIYQFIKQVHERTLHSGIKRTSENGK